MGWGYFLQWWKYSKIDCSDDCTTLWIYQKNQLIVHFTWVNCMLYKLYFNKVFIRKNQQGLVQNSGDKNYKDLLPCLGLKELGVGGGRLMESPTCLERHHQILIFTCKEEAAEICILTSLFSFSVISCWCILFKTQSEVWELEILRVLHRNPLPGGT